MNDLVLLGGGIAAVVLGQEAYRRFLSPRARIRRKLARCKRTLVSEIVGGPTRVTGVARMQRKPMVAPISGRSCAAYELYVQRRVGRWWAEILYISAAEAFVVSDHTGSVEVYPGQHFELALAGGAEDADGWMVPDLTTFARLTDLLESKGAWSQVPLLGDRHSFRYREGAVQDGRQVSVSGWAIREVRSDGDRPADPRSPPEVCCLRANEKTPMLISDGGVVVMV